MHDAADDSTEPSHNPPMELKIRPSVGYQLAIG
jgi:hypothetical protein